jgi:hypothetical protein
VAAGTTQPPTTDVRYIRSYLRAISDTAMGTYQTFSAPSDDVARAFLEACDIDRDLYYLEVETPDGLVGKDKFGLY